MSAPAPRTHRPRLAVVPAPDYASAGIDPNWTPQARHAVALFDMGLNVMPVAHGTKGGAVTAPDGTSVPGYRWANLRYTRLTREGVGHIFSQRRYNIAVITGRTSGNLFVLDCETMNAYHEYAVALSARGVEVVSVRTRRGAHIYLRCADGELAPIPGLPDAELRSAGQYVLTWPSAHPDGGLYQAMHWPGTIPTVTRSQLDFLPVPVELTSRRARRARRLHADTLAFLATGAAEGERNTRLYKAAADYRYVGKPQAAAMSDLLTVAVRCGLAEREAAATIASAYQQRRKTAAISDHDAAAAFLATNPAWVKPVDRRVFEALVIRRAAEPTAAFRATIRELCELTHTSGKQHIIASLHRLADPAHYNPPLISRAGQHTSHDAGDTPATPDGGHPRTPVTRHAPGGAHFSFTDYVLAVGKRALMERQKVTTTPVGGTHAVTSGNLLSQTTKTDAAERGALGHTGMTVIRALATIDAPATTRQIADAGGLTIRQVQYALRADKLLRTSGAVQPLPGGRWELEPLATNARWLDENIAAHAVTRHTRDGITMLKPVKGRSAARAAKHERERALFAEKLLIRSIEYHHALLDAASAPKKPRKGKDKASARHNAPAASSGANSGIPDDARAILTAGHQQLGATVSRVTGGGDEG